MKEWIKAFRLYWLIRWAEHLTSIDKRKRLILIVGGRKRVLLRSDLKKLIKQGVFQKGITIRDIEKRAIYTTY